jgi:tetratricopeptide (TPR) repeat protein
MKNRIPGGYRSSIISVLLAGVMALSCSESELERQFRMEKAINEANKLKEQFYFSGGGLDDSEREVLRKAFESITEMVSVPPDDSSAIANSPEALRVSWQLAGLALYNLGLLEMEMENYDEAFEHFSVLINHYGFKRHQVQRAIFIQALARYRQKRFSEAIALYNLVAQNYAEMPQPIYNPNLDMLESPLLAAKIYRETDEKWQFREQVSDAIDYYFHIITSYEGTPLADAAVGKLASALLLGDLADSAIAALSQVRDPETGKIPPLVLLNIGTIQEKNLRDYEAAEKTFREFMANYPDNRLAASAQLGLGVALYHQKEYEKARHEFSLMDRMPNVPVSLIADAHYLTAVCFEEEGRWNRALGEYDFVWVNHRTTRKGMAIPLHIAEYYLREGKTDLAAQSFSEAEADYKKLADTYAERPAIAASAMAYLIRCYVLQEKWDESVETLKSLALRYPKTIEGYSALPQAADILASKLNKASEASGLLKQYLERYPESPARGKISAYVDSLERISP